MLCFISMGCETGLVVNRFPVSGEITFQGKPVPLGEILFSPDSSKGNQGPASFAVIKDGKYSLGTDKGIVGGPYKLSISGFDGVPDKSGENANGQPIFKTVELNNDFIMGVNQFSHDITK